MKKILFLLFAMFLLSPPSFSTDQVDRMMETYQKQCERIQIEADKKKRVLALSLATKLKALLRTVMRNGNLEAAMKIKKTIAALPTDPVSTNYEQGILFARYEGEWESLPRFSKLTPTKEGIRDTITLTRKEATSSCYGIIFSGYIMIAESDFYTFRLTSDDGSRLFIDGKRLIDNDGIHGFDPETSRRIKLSKGYHKIRVEFFQRRESANLRLEIKGSEDNAHSPVTATMLFHKQK